MGAPVIGTPTLESVLKRDRAVVLASLGGLTGLAWLYLVVLAGDMGDVSAGDGVMAAMALRPWTALDFVLMFLMWVVMMMGMMVLIAARRRTGSSCKRGKSTPPHGRRNGMTTRFYSSGAAHL